jgi:hypothetical protein
MPLLKSDRRPNNELRIGVTGHRFLSEVGKLTAGVDRALAEFERVYPGRAWTIYSPLAEGADQARPG